MKQVVYLLWFEGICPQRLTDIPALSKLLVGGVDLHLTPLPLSEQGQCYYQTLTGMGPAKFGRFDAVRAEAYTIYENTGVPDGCSGCMLPDALRRRKLAVTSLEITDSAGLDGLACQTPDFALIRVLRAGELSPEALDIIVQRTLEIATSSAHVIVLTDVWQPAPRAIVNINDFLADVDLLEVHGPREQSNISWADTLAYGIGSGQLWINLRGREPQGVVGSGREYHEVSTALIRELSSNWLDPQTREPVVEHVFKRDELYSGDYLFKAPDLIVTFRPGYIASPQAQSLKLDGISVQATGNATEAQAPYARMIAIGPTLLNDAKAEAKLIDVMPSVLYMLGQPLPERLDGEVITSVFTPTYRQQTPIGHIEENDDLLSDEEEGLIVDRLRDLGYLG